MLSWSMTLLIQNHVVIWLTNKKDIWCTSSSLFSLDGDSTLLSSTFAYCIHIKMPHREKAGNLVKTDTNYQFAQTHEFEVLGHTYELISKKKWCNWWLLLKLRTSDICYSWRYLIWIHYCLAESFHPDEMKIRSLYNTVFQFQGVVISRFWRLSSGTPKPSKTPNPHLKKNPQRLGATDAWLPFSPGPC